MFLKPKSKPDISSVIIVCKINDKHFSYLTEAITFARGYVLTGICCSTEKLTNYCRQERLLANSYLFQVDWWASTVRICCAVQVRTLTHGTGYGYSGRTTTTHNKHSLISATTTTTRWDGDTSISTTNADAKRRKRNRTAVEGDWCVAEWQAAAGTNTSTGTRCRSTGSHTLLAHSLTSLVRRRQSSLKFHRRRALLMDF